MQPGGVGKISCEEIQWHLRVTGAAELYDISGLRPADGRIDMLMDVPSLFSFVVVTGVLVEDCFKKTICDVGRLLF